MDWIAHLEKGAELYNSGRFEDAIGELEKSLRLRPDDYRTLASLEKSLSSRLNEIRKSEHDAETIRELEGSLVSRLREVQISGEFHTQTKEFIAKNRTPNTKMFNMRWPFLDHALSAISVDGYWLEFGVHEGESINFIAKKSNQAVHGFDSFVGLPESFVGMEKGAFDLAGILPEVSDNVVLHQGWFEDTLPEFVSRMDGPISFLHVDCDLYSSTKCIFDNCSRAIVPGSIIVLDDFYNSPGWQDYVYKAFVEYVEREAVELSYMAFDPYRCCVRIESVRGAV